MKKFFAVFITLLMTVLVFPTVGCTATDDYFEYALSSSGGYEIIGPSESGKKLVAWDMRIPDEILGKPVLSVGESAFDGMLNIQRVVFGKNIDEIKADAFHGCDNIKQISFNENLRFIRDRAFRSCCSLGGMSDQFRHIEPLKFPSSINIIGEKAFEYTSIQGVVFKNSNTIIGDYAFAHSPYLTRIETDYGKKTFHDYTFYDTPLSEVLFPLDWTEEEVKENISLLPHNLEYENAAKYYFSRKEPQKDESGAYLGNYWYYNSDGNVALWK